ncbi:phosphoribosyltransferase [Pantanalinema sp. GBBB05]|uniref:phosphoribosyltransferase n=1 Tax=Pantanalinema sp. GBBB05 TaxID=2604139 RepID=UPI001E0E3F8B|nr:phosphoribosyltransferase [Pantanalinema sp. GBBB05]
MSSTSSYNAKSTVCFIDRQEAGERLAEAVWAEMHRRSLIGQVPPLVYALPRGGISVAAPVAQRLKCPLGVIVAKKITRPENVELAIGAVTATGDVVWSPYLEGQSRWTTADSSSLPPMYATALQAAKHRAQAQWATFATCCPPMNAAGTIALLIDDGIATGMTMAAAVRSLRAQHPTEIWICVPVAPPEVIPALQTWADQVIILALPPLFGSVSRFYRQFPQVEMEAAIEQLQMVNSVIG